MNKNFAFYDYLKAQLDPILGQNSYLKNIYIVGTH